ncbi:MAG: RNA polymerase sigma factor [Cryobacterium sp.]|nr:RNA polymerase sigma factor [Oligoflexia bacterium]
MLNAQTDEQLMIEYRLGNDDAFSILYARHAPKILGYLRLKTSDNSVASEIFQVVFLKLHATRERYRSELPFLPWLFTITRNELIDTMRKKKRNLEDSTEWIAETAAAAESEPPPDEIDLRELPDQQRQALQMRYHEELSFEKIANALGTSSTNARQVVSRGVKSLRKLYEKR